MHNLKTVIYICEEYPSGNKYYYKKEILTNDTWKNLNSLYWSQKKPITEATFNKQKNKGYNTEYYFIDKPMAQIINLF